MNILENGIDSLKKSLFSLNGIEKNEDSLIEYELKDIVIKLHHAIETLVKYMIVQKNEFLIYSKLDDIFRHKFENIINKRNKEEDINTIQFIDAIHRLFVLYDKEITDQDYKYIKELNGVRNSITHYESTMNVNEIKHLITMVLKLMIPIFNEEIDHFIDHLKVEGIDEKIEELYKKDEVWVLTETFLILENIFKAQKNYKERMANIKENKSEFNRNKKIQYCKCDICTKEFFVETQPIFNNGIIIGYVGECQLCGFIKTKEFISFKHMLEQSIFYNKTINENSLDFIYSKIFIGNLYSLTDEYGIESNRFLELKSELIKKSNVFSKIIKNVLYINATNINETQYLNNKDLNKITDNIMEYYKMNRLIRLYLDIFDIDRNTEFFDSGFPLFECESEQDNLIKEAGIKIREWMSDHEIDICDFDTKNILSDNLCYEVISGEIWGELAGTFASDFGTIDCIDEGYIEQAYLINESKEHYKLLIEYEISTNLYTDHEYIDNGSKTLFIEAIVQKNNSNNDIVISGTRLLARF